MTDPITVIGTFSDLKSVKTRSVVQLIVEVPIERASQVVAAFGFPQPGGEIPVVVARMGPEKAKASPDKPKRPFHELPLSQQAGIRCGDEGFWQFLTEIYADEIYATIEAAVRVRQICGVDSRAELHQNIGAGQRWIDLNAEYEQWAGLATEERQ